MSFNPFSTYLNVKNLEQLLWRHIISEATPYGNSVCGASVAIHRSSVHAICHRNTVGNTRRCRFESCSDRRHALSFKTVFQTIFSKHARQIVTSNCGQLVSLFWNGTRAASQLVDVCVAEAVRRQDDRQQNAMHIHSQRPCPIITVRPAEHRRHAKSFHYSSQKGQLRERRKKKVWYILDLCVSSLRRGHANLLCIVPIFADDQVWPWFRFNFS